MRFFPSKKIITDFKNDFLNKVGEYHIVVINGGCPDVSHLGAYIMKNIKCDFVLFWTLNLDKNEYIQTPIHHKK